MNVTQTVPFVDSFNLFQHHAIIGGNVGIVVMAQEAIALGDFLSRIDINPLSMHGHNTLGMARRQWFLQLVGPHLAVSCCFL